MAEPQLIGHYRDGVYRRRVIRVSTGSTALYLINAEDSGAIYHFGVVSTIGIELPRLSTLALGITFDIYFSTADAVGDYTIATHRTVEGIHFALSSLGVVSPSTITPYSTDSPHGMRVTALSSLVWIGEPLLTNLQTSASGAWSTA